MNHSFDTDIAEKYGVNEAILINNLIFWITKNKVNKKNEFEGRTWTYNSVKAWALLFPYLSENKIRKALNNLVQKEVLMSGNFNTNKYDRTKWYAFVDEPLFLPNFEDKSICDNEKIHLLKTTNGFVTNNEPIPDINTDSKPNLTPPTPPVVFKPEEGLEIWNKLVIYNSTKIPLNKLRNKDSIKRNGLLMKCNGITTPLKTEWTKKKIKQEEWKIAVNKYINEMVNRLPNSDYCNHRFSMFDFVKQQNGFTKYLHR